jgi:hypothetical protein
MRIGMLDLDVTFGGRAGALQSAGAVPGALVKELGDNYDFYHALLAGRVSDIGGVPRFEDFDSQDAFFDRYIQVERLVRAEAILRICAAFRRSGRALDAAVPGDSRMIDERGQLVATS